MRATVDGNEAAASVAYRVQRGLLHLPDHAVLADGRAGGRVVEPGAPERLGHGPGGAWRCRARAARPAPLHGALQGGALATTFTASQGLLLMIPNMYKIAGELTSTVLHVAARSLAAQALSIFGDHSDVMAVAPDRLCAAGLGVGAGGARPRAGGAGRDARDPRPVRALLRRLSHLARAATRSRCSADEDVRALISDELVRAHRARALSPERPFIRGTAQNPDVYFQARETVNPFYARVPDDRAGRDGPAAASAPAATTGWSTTAGIPRPSGSWS